MKQLFLFIIVTLLLSRSLTVYAISESPEPSPSPTEPTVAIADILSLEPTSIHDQITPSPSGVPIVSVTPKSEEVLTPTISPTEDEPPITPELFQPNSKEASSSSEIINMVSHQTESTASASTIETGHAENNVTVDNIVNTNITGNNNCFMVLSHNFYTKDILNLTDTCQNIMITAMASSDNETSNQNNTELQTTIQAIANTGKNVLVLPKGSIRTGNSRVQVDVFNLVNTNITGDNTLFGVINLFDPQQGDVILPYELDYVLNGDIPTSQAAIINQIPVQDAQITTNINVIVNTGDNTGAEKIQTGTATATIRLHDKINTSIIGSNFLILEINTFGKWDGEIVGWWGDILTQNNSTFAMYNGVNSTKPWQQKIHTNNTAIVQNTIQVISNTGDNISSEGAEIMTGDASATVNVFDLANTTITGNNWYHVVINIFDSFKGNIIFPRPDLAIKTTTDTNSVNEGDTVRFETHFYNDGLLFARDTLLETKLPEHLEFIEASAGGIFSSGVVRWNLGKLLAKEIGAVWFKTKATKSSDTTTILTTITTSTNEPMQSNNSSVVSLVISLLTYPENNISPSEETIPKKYIIGRINDLDTDIQVANSNKLSQSNDSIRVRRSISALQSVQGMMTEQPFAHAQTIPPSLFFILYMVGSAIVVVKEWLEN